MEIVVGDESSKISNLYNLEESSTCLEDITIVGSLDYIFIITLCCSHNKFPFNFTYLRQNEGPPQKRVLLTYPTNPTTSSY